MRLPAAINGRIIGRKLPIPGGFPYGNGFAIASPNIGQFGAG
jgi:hypothetical protein